MLKRTLRRTVPPVMLFVTAVCVPATADGQEVTRITPKWAKDHPGRLELSRGTAINGSNGYTFRLLTDTRSRFNVLTRVSRRTEKGPLRLFDTQSGPSLITTFVILNASVWPSEELDVSFHVIQELPVFDEGKIKGFQSAREYELHLDDFLNNPDKLPTVDFRAVELAARAAAEEKP